MKAQLIYEVDGERYVLDSSGLSVMDQYTFRNFKNKNDIFSYPRYSKILDKLPTTGKFYIMISQDELTVRAAQFLTIFGRNVFEDEQLFDVIYGSDDHKKVFDSKKYTVRFFTDLDVFEEFYHKTEEFYSSQEKFYHDIGMIYEDSSLATQGVRRVLHEALDGVGSYEMCRIFIDGLSRFDSVKNKNKQDSTSSHK